ALHGIEGGLNQQPLLQAALLQTISSALFDAGRFDRAEPPQRLAVEILKQKRGESDAETLSSMCKLMLIHIARGDFHAASEGFKGAFSRSCAILGKNSPLLRRLRFAIADAAPFESHPDASFERSGWRPSVLDPRFRLKAQPEDCFDERFAAWLELMET